MPEILQIKRIASDTVNLLVLHWLVALFPLPAPGGGGGVQTRVPDLQVSQAEEQGQSWQRQRRGDRLAAARGNGNTVRRVSDEGLPIDDGEDSFGGTRGLGHIREGHLRLGQAYSSQNNCKEDLQQHGM